MNKHTEGPWSVVQNDVSQSIYAKGKECIVCRINKNKTLGSDAHYNAELIASAPELLKAVKTAQGTLDMIESKNGLKDTQKEIVFNTLVKLNQVLYDLEGDTE